MSKVLPGLYLGSFRDAKDTVQHTENKITHILSIHDNSRPLLMDKVYLCLPVSDSPTQNISQYFSACNDFIHDARTKGGNVLVHCLAGVSRSVTIVVAYVMTVTDLGWRDSFNAVRGARSCASPNCGFQRQLLEFQHESLFQERERLRSLYPPSPYPDTEECRRLIEFNAKCVATGEYPNCTIAVHPKNKGRGEGDGATGHTVNASTHSSLLNENRENQKKQGRNLPDEVDNLTLSKSPGQLPTDDSKAFSCEVLKEALDGVSESNATRSEPQDEAGLNANHVEVSDGNSASCGLSEGVDLHGSANCSDSPVAGKPK